MKAGQGGRVGSRAGIGGYMEPTRDAQEEDGTVADDKFSGQESAFTG